MLRLVNPQGGQKYSGPQGRLRKRCKRLTPMQISGRDMRRRCALKVPQGRQNPAHGVASVDTDDDCSGSSRGWARSGLDFCTAADRRRGFRDVVGRSRTLAISFDRRGPLERRFGREASVLGFKMAIGRFLASGFEENENRGALIQTECDACRTAFIGSCGFFRALRFRRFPLRFGKSKPATASRMRAGARRTWGGCRSRETGP